MQVIFFFCTALLNKTETNAVSSEKKKKKYPNVTEENRQWCIRNAKRKPYTQEIWTPGSFSTNKGALLLIFLHVHIFKYTILKCLYRASYALTRGAFHLCLKGCGEVLWGLGRQKAKKKPKQKKTKEKKFRAF